MKSFQVLGRAVLATAALAGAAGLVSSCKDYLEVEPIALNTTEYTFSNVSGATAAIIGAYDPLSLGVLAPPGTRAVTLEVQANRTIVQARGLFNRRPNDEEGTWIQRWAADNHLLIPKHLLV